MASPARRDRDEVIIRRESRGRERAPRERDEIGNRERVRSVSPEPSAGPALYADTTISKDRTKGKQHEAAKVLEEMRKEVEGKQRGRSRSRSRSSRGRAFVRSERVYRDRTLSFSSLSSSPGEVEEVKEAVSESAEAVPKRRTLYAGFPVWRRQVVPRSKARPETQRRSADSDEEGESDVPSVQVEVHDQEDTLKLPNGLQKPRVTVDLATESSVTAQTTLGLDLYDHSDLSLFVSGLLDVIHKLQAQLGIAHEENEDLREIANRRKKDTRTSRDTSSKRADSLTALIHPQKSSKQNPDQSRSSSPAHSQSPTYRHQILHKVMCDHRSHRHGSGIFLDAPMRRGLELNGIYHVWNLTEFLFAHTDIIFIVFKNVSCDGALASLAGLRTRDVRRGQNGAHETPSESEAVFVVSNVLRSAIMEVAECTPFDGSMDEEMLAPYLFVYHHRSKLKDLASKRGGECESQLNCFLDYVESHYGAEYADADAKFAKNLVASQHLTKLWVPNQILVSRKGDHDVAYVLREWPGPGRKRGDTKDRQSLRLSCWRWEYNGDELEREWEVLPLDLAGHDELAIDKLAVYPLRFAPQSLQDRLTERGKKFWSLRHKHLVVYSGKDFNKETTYNDVRFMIDMQTYRKIHKSFITVIRENLARFDSWSESLPRDKDLSNSELTVLPPNMYGFDFREKEWISLSVDLITDVSWNKGSFDRLVLPKKTKELIQALVTVQTSGNLQDIIAGKGNGLIVLLHGGPGTGKTLTAETVAEMAEKPLYRVTCGDIGTNAVQVEKYLTSIFHLGKIWGCVLLLDEADVFLEERSLADLERNSFVSVFLRMLEYYDGIMILTSNRVGSFDAAFKSRIQVSLHYSNLTRASRKKIWQNFIDILDDTDEDVDISELERHLDDLSQAQMNGRQIRNCVTTARQLAVFRKQRLGWQHVEQAITTAQEFEKYLKEVHENLTDDELAREENLR